MINELSINDIIFNYDESIISLDKKEVEIIGQERAIEALKLGLVTDANGYNIFVSGEMSTGRLSAVKQEAEKILDDTFFLFDILFVYNPITPNSPYSLLLERGQGRLFKERMKEITQDNYIRELNDISQSFPLSSKYIDILLRYPYSGSINLVNLVLDRKGETKRPLIIESHPSFENLFGYYDNNSKEYHMGINLGSYHKACGGFLVISAEELLEQKGLWEALKRHLDSTQMALITDNVLGQIGKTERIRPHVIPSRTKIILLGSENIYDSLVENDSAFLRLFKASPQFDYLMENSKENIQGSVTFLINCAHKLNKEISEEALKELLRYSSWFAEERNYLTTQFSVLKDLLTEAVSSSSTITKEDILKALDKREYISSINESKLNEDILKGDLIIDVENKKIGVVNGLAVMDRGTTSFGTPAVISATVAPGSEGIINIEHEAGLSGEIHDKGILILEGYLRKQYARNFPLSMYAGICFEQNYCEIDGDSASSSELYALLSAIGEIPIRGDIAITGSVNQMGFLQPVGGINEKITGFFKTCRNCGLTKTQGVIIPKQNIKCLILPHEVENAIKEGSFHLWALNTIEEGFSLLSGLKPGVRDKRGNFTVGSFNRIIEERLKKLYENGRSN